MTTPSKKTPQRYAMVIGVKPEKLDKYKRLHADPWQGVLDTLKKHNVQNYSIHLYDHTLFSYMEYTGDDFDADMAGVAQCPITQQWWDECIPCQVPLTAGNHWTPMEEVFYMP